MVMWSVCDGAKQITVTGWSCVKCGRFYGAGESAEHSARYCCHTEAACTCGARKKRHQSYCESCHHVKKVARYEAIQQVEGATEPTTDAPWSILDDDSYFFDLETLVEWCVDRDVKPSDMFFVMCKPHNPGEFSISEFVQDHLPDDDDYIYDQAAIDAEKAVNAVLRAGEPWSWYPDHTRRPAAAALIALDAMCADGGEA